MSQMRHGNSGLVIETSNVLSIKHSTDFQTLFIREESKVLPSARPEFCFPLCISSFSKPDANADRFPYCQLPEFMLSSMIFICSPT